jgi:hypothetical protein
MTKLDGITAMITEGVICIVNDAGSNCYRTIHRYRQADSVLHKEECQ